MTEKEADSSQLDFLGVINPRAQIWLDLTALLVLCLLFNFVQFQTAEFFRHTEADRTLISWEMLERNSYLVPHLVGSPILTKPPLFYWLMVGSFKLFGEVSEFTARFPSLCAATLLVLLQYIVTVAAGGSRKFARLAALFLLTSPLYLTLSSVAEIDMTFGLLNAASIYLAYLGATTPAPLLLVLSYLVAALAFLTKGPPVILFFGATIFIFSIWLELTRRRSPEIHSQRPLIKWHLLGIALFLALSGCWLAALSAEVSWQAVQEQFRVEIVERVVSESRRGRGPLFYPWSLFVGLLPWGIFLVAGFVSAISGRFGLHFRVFRSSPRLWTFFVFNCIVVALAVVVMSFAAGKSARYIFPIYPSAVQLAVFGLMFLSRSTLKETLYRTGTYIAAGAALPVLVAPFLLNLQGVPTAVVVGEAALCIASLVYLQTGCRQRSGATVIQALLLLMVAFRIGDRAFYIPHQNSTRQVSSIAAEINSTIPAGAPIYTLEMYERWVVYYLKKLGRPVNRLSPELRPTARDLDGWVYLLITYEHEAWRLAQLSLHDAQFKVLSHIKRGRENIILVAVHKDSLHHLTLRPDFPVTPSPQFYGESFAKDQT